LGLQEKGEGENEKTRTINIRTKAIRKSHAAQKDSNTSIFELMIRMAVKPKKSVSEKTPKTEGRRNL